MAGFKAIMKSGHPPTLIASFLYFDFCFAVWVLNGAMAPFLTEQFHLTPAQTEGVTIHYARRIEDVLAIALPKNAREERLDEVVREEVLEHADA